MCSVLCLFRLAKAVGDDLEPLLDLRLFDGQRHQDAQHVVVRPAGEQDQAFVAGAGDVSAVSLAFGLLRSPSSNSSMAIIAPRPRTSPISG